MSPRKSVNLEIASVATVMLALASAAGCGGRSDIGTVTGRVTRDGQPLQGLEIMFAPQGEGRNSVGYTDADGKYELQYTLDRPGARVGQHQVAVIDRTGKIPIPPDFMSLTFEVKPGRNQFDIDIPGQ